MRKWESTNLIGGTVMPNNVWPRLGQANCLPLILWTGLSSTAYALDVVGYDRIKQIVESISSRYNYYKADKDGDLGGNCNDFTAMSGAGNSGTRRERALADVAGKIIYWKNELSAMGYPHEVWSKTLNMIENDLVRQASTPPYSPNFTPAGMRLVKIGNDYRAASGLNLKRLQWVDPGCGAGGEVEVKLVSKPPGGQISIIPEFNYELCKAGGSALPGGNCKSWRRVKYNDSEELSSTYYIFIDWNGKTAGPMKYDFSKIRRNQTITVGN